MPVIEYIAQLIYDKLNPQLAYLFTQLERKIMSIIEEKLKVLSKKNAFLLETIKSEREQVTSVVTNLQNEVSTLSTNLSELLQNIDDSDQTVAAVAKKLDLQIESIEKAITFVQSIYDNTADTESDLTGNDPIGGSDAVGDVVGSPEDTISGSSDNSIQTPPTSVDGSKITE